MSLCEGVKIVAALRLRGAGRFRTYKWIAEVALWGCKEATFANSDMWARVKTPWPLFLSYFKPYRHYLLVIVLQGNCLILLEL